MVQVCEQLPNADIIVRDLSPIEEDEQALALDDRWKLAVQPLAGVTDGYLGRHPQDRRKGVRHMYSSRMDGGGLADSGRSQDEAEEPPVLNGRAVAKCNQGTQVFVYGYDERTKLLPKHFLKGFEAIRNPQFTHDNLLASLVPPSNDPGAQPRERSERRLERRVGRARMPLSRGHRGSWVTLKSCP